MEKQDNFLKIILNSAPVMLLALDQGGQVALCEGQVFDDVAEGHIEPVGKSYQEVFAPYPEIISAIEKAYAGDASGLVLDNGKTVIEVRLTPVLDSAGDVSGVTGFSFDVSEQKRTESALVTQKQLFENLVAIARATTELPTLEATLQNALNVAAEMTGAELGSLFLLNEDGEVLHSLLARGRAEPKEKREYVKRAMTGGLAGWVVRNREPVLIHDTTEDDRWLERPGDTYRPKSSLSVPILIQERVLGVLTLTHPEPQRFSDEHLNLIQAAADQMALALRNAQMYEEQRRLADFQLTLYEVLRNVGRHLDTESVARVAVEEIVRLTNWHWVAVAFPEEENEELRIHSQAGDFSLGEGWTVPYDHPVLGKAFTSGKIQLVPNIAALPETDRLHPNLASELAIPLKRGDQILGVLDISSIDAGAFNASDVQLAESLADAVSLTLDNARLFQDSQDTADRLRELDRLKSSFMANMSHELRTPLNAILGYSELLHEDAKDFGIEEFAADLEKIQRAGKHLLAVINDILDFSKIEAGRMDIFLEAFDVPSLIDDVVTTIRPVIEKNDNVFEFSYDDDLGSMTADPTKIRQIIINLLSNAAKFSEHGRVDMYVDRVNVDGEEWINFTVQDNGIGMSKKQLENLFQPFVQGDISTTRKYGGTGLGLAITRGFCQMMGGDIEVESELGHGSKFTVRIPAEVSEFSSQLM